MVLFLFSFTVLAFKAAAYVEVGCAAGEECPDASEVSMIGGQSEVKPRAASAMLQKRSQAILTEERVRSTRAKSKATDDFVSPQDLMTCPGEIISTTTCMTRDTYDLIVDRIKDVLEAELSLACNATDCQQADWAGCVLRMAGHDSMDYKSGQGGSDGCTDMAEADNAGLAECLSSGEFGFSLNSVYPEFCQDISLADFIVIAAQAVMSILATDGTPRETLTSELKGNFRFGRTTLTGDDCKAVTHWSGNHLLPNPAGGCDEVERVFVTNMGLNWEESTAFMGVHTLGRCKVENSGYDGWWDTPEHSRTFNNHYYVALIATSWCPEKNVAGNEGKHQWRRCDTGSDKFTHKEMMLNTDMCLAYTDVQGNSLIAGEKDSECCAWVKTLVGVDQNPNPSKRANRVGSYRMEEVIANNKNSFCNVQCGGTFINKLGVEKEMKCFEDSRDQMDIEFQACCELETSKPRLNCHTPGMGSYFEQVPSAAATRIEAVRLFAGDEMLWVKTFLKAWTIAVENGFTDSLQTFADSCPTSSAPTPATPGPTAAEDGWCNDYCSQGQTPWNIKCVYWSGCTGCSNCS